MVKLFQALFDRIFAAAGALFFSQLPHFFQSYTQRLGGHLEEIRMQILNLETAAAKSGKSLTQYIEKFVSSPDRDFAAQGEYMQSLLTRVYEIGNAYNGMIESSPWARPLHFLQTIQADIAKLAYQDFTFGLELTPESGIYALLGMGVGILLFNLINGVLSMADRGLSFICHSIKQLFRKRYA